jgi:hypothetical protein
VSACGESYVGGRHVGGRLHPRDRVADLLDGIDERQDVARDVVEEVHGGHGAGSGLSRDGEKARLASVTVKVKVKCCLHPAGMAGPQGGAVTNALGAN